MQKENKPFVRFKKLVPNAVIPHRAHHNDAGLDVCAIENGCIHAGKDGIIKTGLSIAVPDGWVAIVKEKSGLATTRKISVGACVIDSGYRGEILIHLFNNDATLPFTYGMGLKVAQLVVVPCWIGQPVEVEELEETERGEGRFGSTGDKISPMSLKRSVDDCPDWVNFEDSWLDNEEAHIKRKPETRDDW